jgi:hypothetical protein
LSILVSAARVKNKFQGDKYVNDYRGVRVGEELRPTMELSEIRTVSDKIQSVSLREIEVSDYYFWHIRLRYHGSERIRLLGLAIEMKK